MFKHTPDRKQAMLLPPRIDDYVSATHRVRLIVEVVERLDLSNFKVGTADTGRAAFPPAALVSLLLYSFSIGVFSAREMARRLETDCAFLFATSGLRPGYRTIARFRTDESEALASVFAKVVVVCREVGLGNLDVVAIDGTRVRANASLDAHTRRSQLEAELAKAKEHVAKLLEEAGRVDAAEDLAARAPTEVPEPLAAPQRRVVAIERALAEMAATGREEVNTTDPDARIQRCKDGNRPGYNVQLAVSGTDGLIVACDVVNDAGDTAQLLPVADAVVAEVGPVGVVVADGGYNGGANVQGFVERNQDAVLAASTEKAFHERARATGRFQWVDFAYDPNSEDRRARHFGVRRKAMIEGHFRYFKHNLRWRQFLARGLQGCRAEFRLLATTYNLLKLALFRERAAAAPVSPA